MVVLYHSIELLVRLRRWFGRERTLAGGMSLQLDFVRAGGVGLELWFASAWSGRRVGLLGRD